MVSRSVVSDSSWPHRLHHRLPEFAQTHVHHVGDATQLSHPLSSPSPPAFNLSQHQGLFQSQFFTSGGQRTGASASATVLPVNIQDWFPSGWTGWISLQSKGLSSTIMWKHQFFGTQPSLQFSSHMRTWLLEKPWLWPNGLSSAQGCLCILICCLGLSPPLQYSCLENAMDGGAW